MSVTVLFWNVRGHHEESWEHRNLILRQSLGRMAITHQIDILMLAEYAFKESELLESLNQAGVGEYYAIPSSNPRIRLFSRLQKTKWTDRFRNSLDNRMTFHTVRVGNTPSFLLVGIHGPDRRNQLLEADRASEAQDFAADIRTIERDVKHRRTIVVGDFNMTPYEHGMVSMRCFHAVMSKQLVRRINSVESRTGFPCFYNPMWSNLGDQNNRPPGSYFFSNFSSATNTFWVLLDQVLVREELMDNLSQPIILNHDGTVDLVRPKGHPYKNQFSDHLPILFAIDPPTRKTNATENS